mgnify:CR=1 FL=1
MVLVFEDFLCLDENNKVLSKKENDWRRNFCLSPCLEEYTIVKTICGKSRQKRFNKIWKKWGAFTVERDWKYEKNNSSLLLIPLTFCQTSWSFWRLKICIHHNWSSKRRRTILYFEKRQMQRVKSIDVHKRHFDNSWRFTFFTHYSLRHKTWKLAIWWG